MNSTWPRWKAHLSPVNAIQNIRIITIISTTAINGNIRQNQTDSRNYLCTIKRSSNKTCAQHTFFVCSVNCTQQLFNKYALVNKKSNLEKKNQAQMCRVDRFCTNFQHDFFPILQKLLNDSQAKFSICFCFSFHSASV